MSQINGCRTICDRCKAEVFSAHIGDGEMDGGFTRWNKFEPKPRGWTRKEGRDLCPECAAEWNKLEVEFMNKTLHFFKEVKA